jgi:hypothetical protein
VVVAHGLELEAFHLVINLVKMHRGYLLWTRMYSLLQTAFGSNLQLEFHKDQSRGLDSENALLY